MADTKALFTQRFDAARTALSEGNERAGAEALREAIAAARSDSGLHRELASALFHLGRLTRKLGPTGEAEAGSLLTEALSISEALYGRKDASLAPVLQELSRVHLQQSRHASAHNALERLLAIARLKGEDHPDVAAALFDLAFVKRKLGDDAAAEGLYRDSLRIRETVLGADHTVTVATLERLSDTCVARGNISEALPLLRRALTSREASLGADHERVRSARARVAELESQMATAADTAAPATPPVVRPAPRSREFAKTPTVAAAVAAASLIASAIPSASASPVVISASESVAGRESHGAQPEVVFAEAARAEVASVDVARSDASVDEWGSSAQTIPPAPAKKRTVMYASAGVAAVGMAMAGLLMARPHAGSAKPPASKGVAAESRTAGARTNVAAPVTKAASSGSLGAAVVAANADSARGASLPAARTAAAVQQDQHASEGAPAELRLPRVALRLDSVNIPSIPAMPSGDAILRSAIERQRAADTDRAEPKDVVTRAAPSDVANAHTSPKIIGRVPDPAFPPELLRAGIREGQVLVRFMVNELGRVDVTSVVVERSDDELFTAAVRDILPSFRFEPAHTLGRESQPVSVWVSVPFRFTTKKK